LSFWYVTLNVIVVEGVPVVGVTEGFSRFTGGAARTGATTPTRMSVSATIGEAIPRTQGFDRYWPVKVTRTLPHRTRAGS
jgi:hypothetical protein